MEASDIGYVMAGAFFGFVACMVIVCCAADWRDGR